MHLVALRKRGLLRTAKNGSRDHPLQPPNNLGLVGYWNFDEGTSTTATDFSGNGNTGTLTNMESTDWASGKRGRALDFDGRIRGVGNALESPVCNRCDDLFSVSFVKNGVRYIAVTLPKGEARLTDILKTWQFTD